MQLMILMGVLGRDAPPDSRLPTPDPRGWGGVRVGVGVGAMSREAGASSVAVKRGKLVV